MDRRDFVNALGRGVIAGGVLAAISGRAGAQQSPRAQQPAAAAKPPAQPALPQMTVYKSATCGCCKGWVDHARQAGFTVRAIDTEDLPGVKAQMGVPAALQSCHTVVVGSYVVEGHVPADDVKRMLKEKPAIKGIAVPGMPVGSPGMEMGARKDRYDVVAFLANGTTKVFASHG